MPTVPNPCSICHMPIYGSYVGTGNGSMKDGGSFAHWECYDQPLAASSEAEAASRIAQLLATSGRWAAADTMWMSTRDIKAAAATIAEALAPRPAVGEATDDGAKLIADFCYEWCQLDGKSVRWAELGESARDDFRKLAADVTASHPPHRAGEPNTNSGEISNALVVASRAGEATGAEETFETVRLETISRVRKHYESCGFMSAEAHRRAELRIAYLLHLASIAHAPAGAETAELLEASQVIGKFIDDTACHLAMRPSRFAEVHIARAKLERALLAGRPGTTPGNAPGLAAAEDALLNSDLPESVIWPAVKVIRAARVAALSRHDGVS